jgi:hypothetical protein
MPKDTAEFKIEFLGDTAEAKRSIAELEQYVKMLSDEFKKADFGSQKFDVLKTALADAKVKLDGFTGSADKMKAALTGAKAAAEETASATGKTKVSLAELAGSVAGVAASVAGLVGYYAAAISKSREFEAAQMKLQAASKLTGTSFSFLQQTSQTAQDQFGLSSRQANELTTSIAKLTSKAGNLKQTSDAMRTLLDLAAAQGLSADDALQAINQAILGIDEGTDKLFQKNPSVIYEEYAQKVGLVASKMTDQQKAQALTNELITQGGKVAGQYAAVMDTAAGKQQRFNNELDKFQASIGKEADKILGAMLSVLTPLVQTLNNMPAPIKAAATAFVAVTAAVAALSASLAALRIALAATGIGLIPLAIGAAAAAIMGLTSALTDTSDEAQKFSDSLRKMDEDATASINAIKSLKFEVDALGRSSAEAAKRNDMLKSKVSKLKDEAIESTLPKTAQEARVQSEKLRSEMTALNQRRLVLESERKVLDEADAELSRRVAKKGAASKEAVARDINAARLNEVVAELENVRRTIVLLGNERESLRDFEQQSARSPRKSGKAKSEKTSLPEVAPPDLRGEFAALELFRENRANQRRATNAQNLDGQISRMTATRDFAGLGQLASQYDAVASQKESELVSAESPERAQEIAEEMKFAQSAAEKIRTAFAQMPTDAEMAVAVLQSGFGQISRGFGDALGNAIVSAGGIVDAQIGAALEAAAKQFVAKLVSDLVTSGLIFLFKMAVTGGGASFGSIFSSVSGFAAGGRPRAAEPVLVGERGPEMFIPDASGRVVPNNQISTYTQPNSMPEERSLEVQFGMLVAQNQVLVKTLQEKQFNTYLDGGKLSVGLEKVDRLEANRVF